MIYGIVASETPTVVVPTPEAGADFIAGTYDWQGTPITASQFTDKSAWIGAGGLQVPASGASAKIIYAALKTFLASCSWTVVIEAETLNTATVWHPLVVSSSGDGMWVDLQAIPFGTVEWYCNDRDASSQSKFSDHYHAIPIGIHKVALTRTDLVLSISADGNSTSTTTDPPNSLPYGPDPMINFWLGTGNFWGTNGTAVNIRSFAAYAAQDDSVLPSLSGA